MISTFFKSKRARKEPVLTRAAAMACIPLRHPRVHETVLENGLVQLTYPIVVRSFLTGLKMMVRFQGAGGSDGRQKKVELDNLGTEVWQMIDGHCTVGRMAVRFARAHKLSQAEAESAVTQFLHTLGKRGIIGMQPASASADH